jgi:hypothetical protein
MDELTVHDVTMQDQQRLGRGRAMAVTHVTFYVGEHGPFFWDVAPGPQASAEIQAYIQQKVADLRAITQRSY